MLLLMLTTLLWAFSFSLIGEYLAGHVDTWFAVLMRVLLAFVGFIPFWRRKGMNLTAILLFMGIGVIQLGIMYLLYYQSYLYLSVPEILLFTIVTPIYVTLIYDLLKKQPLRLGYLFSALLAVYGAAIIRNSQVSDQFWFGLLLIQGANLCFAIGQVGYKYLMERYTVPQKQAFSWFYFGALCITIICWLFFGDRAKLPTTSVQWSILIWLGAVASGLGYFMWNYGATQVDAGTLAIMNNALIPAGLIVNIVIWHKDIDYGRFIIGSAIILASLFIHRYFIVQRYTISK